MIGYATLATFAVAAIVFVYQCTHETADEICLAQSKLGGMLGTHLFTFFKNQRYCAYRGIRFAKAPTGDLRFKVILNQKYSRKTDFYSETVFFCQFQAPVPVDRWDNVYVASNYGPICRQVERVFNYTESEDCLFVNVFTPNPTKCGRKRLPVVASVYGGGFVMGLSDDLFFGADLLMEQCVVLVTMNYRLGPFGFLSLAQPEYSGNMGLKDQQLALKWVHDNIYAFGGDKRNVTLIGNSAG